MRAKGVLWLGAVSIQWIYHGIFGKIFDVLDILRYFDYFDKFDIGVDGLCPLEAVSICVSQNFLCKKPLRHKTEHYFFCLIITFTYLEMRL